MSNLLKPSDNAPKRYLLFAFDCYYPNGGFEDLIGSYETFEQAVDQAHKINADFCDIVDLWRPQGTMFRVKKERNYNFKPFTVIDPGKWMEIG